MKKVISLSLLVIIMIIICLFCLSPITKDSMTHVAKEDTLYSKALDYVISKQKNASYHKDKEDYHIFTDYIPYGIEEVGHYQHIFMWIHLESFYVLNDELIQDESFSIPYKSLTKITRSFNVKCLKVEIFILILFKGYFHLKYKIIS